MNKNKKYFFIMILAFILLLPKFALSQSINFDQQPQMMIEQSKTKAFGGFHTIARGNKQYELTNHLGNVLATISDSRMQAATPENGSSGITSDLISANDYYAFGMEMPGRKFAPEKYKFGFNGKFKDDEVYGDGNFQDYGFRMYDTRIARFISVDPLTKEYPELTPFQFASNNPIENIDIDGLEGKSTITKAQKKSIKNCFSFGGIRIKKIKFPKLKIFKEVTKYEDVREWDKWSSGTRRDKDMSLNISLNRFRGNIIVDWDLKFHPDIIQINADGQEIGGSFGRLMMDFPPTPLIIPSNTVWLNIKVFHGPTRGTEYDVRVYSDYWIKQRITTTYLFGIIPIKRITQKFDDRNYDMDYSKRVKWKSKI